MPSIIGNRVCPGRGGSRPKVPFFTMSRGQFEKSPNFAFERYPLLFALG
jgi:hypothetical protein